ncbi:hypothetical protein Runsl_0276 [Runella slithyformis DSM 19594]|uniref:Uncharacterized protein n=1 Tax=Runella slithyformis (strain ATCC 29530 / DSM 19594 / LMG 11500 / NCIMB 11436 / LSU 4) TaxID=761193 RepID=A0A7U4E3T7_RUNSL|nr:hypothetical protein Runsl_0276 [Runella slithyformis DSM 19594]
MVRSMGMSKYILKLRIHKISVSGFDAALENRFFSGAQQPKYAGTVVLNRSLLS